MANLRPEQADNIASKVKEVGMSPEQADMYGRFAHEHALRLEAEIVRLRAIIRRLTRGWTGGLPDEVRRLGLYEDERELIRAGHFDWKDEEDE